jgi:hypothetical protein
VAARRRKTARELVVILSPDAYATPTRRMTSAISTAIPRRWRCPGGGGAGRPRPSAKGACSGRSRSGAADGLCRAGATAPRRADNGVRAHRRGCGDVVQCYCGGACQQPLRWLRSGDGTAARGTGGPAGFGAGGGACLPYPVRPYRGGVQRRGSAIQAHAGADSGTISSVRAARISKKGYRNLPRVCGAFRERRGTAARRRRRCWSGSAATVIRPSIRLVARLQRLCKPAIR